MATPQNSKAATAAKAPVETDGEQAHPAVDNDLRAGTTSKQNRIDFNDPTMSGQDAVAQNLAEQRT
ncbi:MAG: hypothetical protein B7X90_01805 [Novosphingobium sp. 17-62-19]|uniref:hypothetical protein n=1 Tax=Novosphingobium sp. 17-62-19 TaxID=1970406 RepID=UPI000BD38283|nr:hypothetical protein [Novosphingobium sp. 17-62-19]OZA21372.1 MAG: hypothetical protein B7X90_01805 [Novosphingobium sp. 17-62-19]OZA67312.1 MAG: hypothetical protein B7X78_04135 [Sphingomonadales bacterium 39-62-4]HQS95083.1 hypothetical protein [Novosphingobium sp.]